MKIENDRFVFEDSDINQLSEKLQNATAAFVGAQLTIAEFLSNLVNTALAQATAASIATRLAEFSDALVVAPPDKQIQAEELLQQAKDSLTVQMLPKKGA